MKIMIIAEDRWVESSVREAIGGDGDVDAYDVIPDHATGYDLAIVGNVPTYIQVEASGKLGTLPMIVLSESERTAIFACLRRVKIVLKKHLSRRALKEAFAEVLSELRLA